MLSAFSVFRRKKTEVKEEGKVAEAKPLAQIDVHEKKAESESAHDFESSEEESYETTPINTEE